MLTILLVIHLLITLALIGVVLVQRSEGGALGIGGGASSFMTARGASNLLTRTTAILATLFMVNSLVIASISGTRTARTPTGSIMETLPAPGQTPGQTPAPQVPTNN